MRHLVSKKGGILMERKNIDLTGKTAFIACFSQVRPSEDMRDKYLFSLDDSYLSFDHPTIIKWVRGWGIEEDEMIPEDLMVFGELYKVTFEKVNDIVGNGLVTYVKKEPSDSE